MNRLAIIFAAPLMLGLSNMAPSALAAAGLKPALAKPRSSAPVASANRKAFRDPGSSRFVNAGQIYPWTEGAVYRLYSTPDEVSMISLQAGEQLVSVAAGDTARWVIGDTTSGAGPTRRTHILVKPSQSGLRTNLVVATDRRVYHILVSSGAGAAMTAMSWTYPQDELLALKQAAESRAAALPLAGDIAVDRLNFNYDIRGERTPWRPVRAFDDGAQTFIEFPQAAMAGELPPLFVVGRGGKAELVNYRARGRYYVVDRLFAEAELRLGEKRQTVVRVIRKGGR